MYIPFFTYFLSPYRDAPFRTRKKAWYTLIITMLLALVVLVSILLRSIMGVYNCYVHFQIISIATGVGAALLFLRLKKLEGAVNLLMIAGFMRSLMLLYCPVPGHLYTISMLVLLALAVIYIRRYQLIIVTLFYITLFSWKVFHLYKTGITSQEFLQHIYILFILVVFLMAIHLLIRIIDREIEATDALERSHAQIEHYSHELEALNHTLEDMATHDTLTGCLNRRRLDSIYQHETGRCTRHNCTISMIMIDIDHFKKVNDHYGHDTGDRVLVVLSDYIHDNIRANDYLIRWGGEEFILITPITGLDEAVVIAEKLRLGITELRTPGLPDITISAGVSEWSPGNSLEHLIKQADNALYRAKENGRNRTESTRSCLDS